MLKGKKTYIVAALMFIIGVINVLTGDASGWEAIQENANLFLDSAAFAAVRRGIG